MKRKDDKTYMTIKRQEPQTKSNHSD